MTQQNTFVISDPHFGHSRIIEYCDRPFDSVDHMNEVLIENWNNTVGDNDLVICNGDFMFYKKDDSIFNALNGKKILVLGNHDHKATVALSWEAVHDIYSFKHNDKMIVMCHYPIFSWPKKFHGAIHLYGHVHNVKEDQLEMPNAHNICVEYWNYTPINLNVFTNEIPHFDYQNAKWFEKIWKPKEQL
jgi:calcineurin-like phosphoesterase family protein